MFMYGELNHYFIATLSCRYFYVDGQGPELNDYASTLNDQSQPWWTAKAKKLVSRAVCSISVECRLFHHC